MLTDPAQFPDRSLRPSAVVPCLCPEVCRQTLDSPVDPRVAWARLGERRTAVRQQRNPHAKLPTPPMMARLFEALKCARYPPRGVANLLETLTISDN